MIKHKLAVLAAVAFLSHIQSADATQRSDLDKQGLQNVTAADVTSKMVSRTCRGTTFDDKGKKVNTFVNVYRKDGTALKTVTTAGKADARERKWWMEGKNFCETLYRTDEKWCNHTKDLFILKGQFYLFHKNGAVQGKFKC